jgi:hypothetical protein
VEVADNAKLASERVRKEYEERRVMVSSAAANVAIDEHAFVV